MLDLSARISTLLTLDPAHRAVQFEGAWLTWGDMATLVTELDRLFSRAGLGEGATIALITRNRPAHVAAIEAILSTRRCLVPITSISSDILVCSEVERLGVTAVLADHEDWAREGLKATCARLGVLGIELDSNPLAANVLDGLAITATTAETLVGVGVLMPTSGTTGLPKRIEYTYDKLNGALDRISHYSASTARSLGGPPALRNSAVLSTLAFAHVAGLWAVLQAMCEGRCIALLERFEPHAWAALVEEHQAKLSSLPPATIRMVLDANVAPEQLRSLVSVNCGTAALDPDVADEFTSRYGIPVLTAYGATEFPGGLVGWTLADYKQFADTKRGSAGRARPGIRIKITDPETGSDVPWSTEGTVTVFSPQATGPTVDGWVATNDIGRMDEDGFVWIVGRSDDAINRGGFKIVPQVVEKVLRDHPAVTDAGVTGVPDVRLGHVPVAAVTVRFPVTEDELKAWAGERLAKYQIPTEIRIVDELPRTTSLKVSKDGLRQLFQKSK